MPLTLNLAPEAEERLRHKAQLIGVSEEEARRKAVEAAKEPEGNPWVFLGFILVMCLLAKTAPIELDEEMNESWRVLVDHLLKNGNEEQLAALLPKMPPEPVDERTWGARTMDAMEAEGVIGVLWMDRSESGRELADEFKRLAETRGPLPCE